MGVILVAVYMVFKGKSLIARGRAFKVACEKLMQSRVSWQNCMHYRVTIQVVP